MISSRLCNVTSNSPRPSFRTSFHSIFHVMVRLELSANTGHRKDESWGGSALSVRTQRATKLRENSKRDTHCGTLRETMRYPRLPYTAICNSTFKEPCWNPSRAMPANGDTETFRCANGGGGSRGHSGCSGCWDSVETQVLEKVSTLF